VTADAQAVFVVLLAIARDAATLTKTIRIHAGSGRRFASMTKWHRSSRHSRDERLDRAGDGGEHDQWLAGLLSSGRRRAGCRAERAVLLFFCLFFFFFFLCAGALALYRELAVAVESADSENSERSIKAAAHTLVAG